MSLIPLKNSRGRRSQPSPPVLRSSKSEVGMTRTDVAWLKLGIYKHYKGNLYRVLGVGRHTESGEEVVIYQSLYGDYGLWVRPRTMFEETIEIDGKIVPRFTYLQECFVVAPRMRD